MSALGTAWRQGRLGHAKGSDMPLWEEPSESLTQARPHPGAGGG